MPHQHQRPAAAVGVVAAALVLAGCGLIGQDQDDAQPSRPTTPAPSGTGPYTPPAHPSPAEPLGPGKTGTPRGGLPDRSKTDQHDATTVSKAGLTVMFRYDTSMDTSPHDASIRAARLGWCTPGYARELKKTKPRSAPGAEWNTWQSHHAYTRVSLQHTEDAGRPPDTATTATREWTVTTTPHGRDGWKGHHEETTAFVQMNRHHGGPWRIAGVTVQ